MRRACGCTICEADRIEALWFVNLAWQIAFGACYALMVSGNEVTLTQGILA